MLVSAIVNLTWRRKCVRTLTINNQKGTQTMKRLTFQNRIFPATDSPFGTIQLKRILLEPLLVVGACLLWVAILPIAGVLCAGIGTYDKVAALHLAKQVQMIFARA